MTGSGRHAIARGIAFLVLTLALAAPATAAAVVTPTGTYAGTHKNIDYGECGNPCRDDPAVVEVVPREGGGYLVYYWNQAVAGDRTKCGTAALSSSCVLFTAEFDANTGVLTGTGLTRPDYVNGTALPLVATLTGDALTGRADWQREASCTNTFRGVAGCYYQFAVAREGAPEQPVQVAIGSGPPDVTEDTRAAFT
jgi:hypothetical protein